MTFGARRYVWALLLVAWLTPLHALAATPADKAAAQALFDDAIKLMADKSYAEACRKLEESQRLDPAMGTRYQLAQCYEATGRTASAWAGFLEVADLARAAGQGARERAARERADGLQPRVSRLVIETAAPDREGLEVRRDEVVVGQAQWGVAIPVDPGSHRVTASAPGKMPWASDVMIPPTGGEVHVRIPALQDAPAVPPASPPLPPPLPVAAPPIEPVPSPPLPAPPAAASHGTTRRTLGIVTTSLGAAGVITSVVLGLVARSEYTGTGGNCTMAGCNAAGKNTTDSARRLGDVATGVFVAGAVVGVGGAVVWLTAPTDASRAIAPRVGVGVGANVIVLSGSF
jgi:hypothetical protein